MNEEQSGMGAEDINRGIRAGRGSGKIGALDGSDLTPEQRKKEYDKEVADRKEARKQKILADKAKRKALRSKMKKKGGI